MSAAGRLDRRRGAALVRRQLGLRALRSPFGALWPLLAPALLVVVYAHGLSDSVGRDVDDYALHLAAGLVPWSFVAQALPQCLYALSNDRTLLRGTTVRTTELTEASVVVSVVHLLPPLAVVCTWGLVTGRTDPADLPLLAVPLAGLVCAVAALGNIVGLIDLFTRDLRHVLANVLTAWLFLTPILFAPGELPALTEAVARVEPVSRSVRALQATIHAGQTPLDAGVLLSTAGALAALLVSRRIAAAVRLRAVLRA